MVAQLKKEQQRELDAFNSNMKQEQSELKKQVAAQETVSKVFSFSLLCQNSRSIFVNLAGKLCLQFNDRKSRQTTLKNRKTQLDQHQKYKESAFR